ncbi:MAG: hypothetical protein LC620_03480, partial [Halobacteriales archaeon]|nr:hypothetical protein [Halobacteriales archaeon]
MATGRTHVLPIALAFLVVAGAWQAAALGLPAIPPPSLAPSPAPVDPSSGPDTPAPADPAPTPPAQEPSPLPAPLPEPPVPGYRNGPPLAQVVPPGESPQAEPGQAVSAPAGGLAPPPYASGSFPDAANDVNGGDPAAHPTVLDTDDDAAHRARFSLDRNWALAHSLVTAVSRSSPSALLTSVHWDYDTTPLAPGTTTADVQVTSLLLWGFDGSDAIAFRPLSPGLHHLTLTATFTDAGRTYVDRVTSPLYVEPTALSLVAAEDRTATWEPSALDAAQDALGGDPGPLAGIAAQTARDAAGAALGPTPNVLVLGDFLGDYARQAPLLVPLDGVPGLLAPLASVPGFDPAAGLGAVGYASATTGLGEPTTHVGATLVRSLVESGSANVLFASVLSPATGTLDRSVLRNALLLARHGGRDGVPPVDAVLWGLPSSILMPAALQDTMRPDLAVAQTPNVPLAADAPLPAATADWHGVDAGHATGPELKSVLEEVLD